MKTGKRKMTVIALGLILGLVLCINPIYALEFDKQEMDVALREELSKIPDPAVREAIIEEYKEVLMEAIPELDIEEATCQSCEEDLKKLKQEKINAVIVDKEEFKTERETTGSQAEEEPEPEPEPEIVLPPPSSPPQPQQEDPPPPCTC